MSTSAAIGATTKGGWRGVYSYSDGYPLMQGRALWFIYQRYFKGNINGFVKWATAHEWRTFLKRNIQLRPTHIGTATQAEARLAPLYDAMGKGLPPECYCHGDGAQREGPSILTHKSTDGCQWAYVIDAPRHRLRVLKAVGSAWEQVESINLDDPKEPNWLDVQCGKHKERCNHSEGWHDRAGAGSDQYFMEWEALVNGWGNLTDADTAKHEANMLRDTLKAVWR